MDPYTAEKLFVERRREIAEAAERRERLFPACERSARPTRVWVAGRLRALADRLDSAYLQRA